MLYESTSYSCLVVLIGLFFAHLSNFTLNSDLTLERPPPECCCSKWVFTYFLAFTRFIVRIPHKAIIVEIVTKYHSIAWLTIFGRSCKTHRVGLKHFHWDSKIKPLFKQIHWVSTFGDHTFIKVKIIVLTPDLCHLLSHKVKLYFRCHLSCSNRSICVCLYHADKLVWSEFNFW